MHVTTPHRLLTIEQAADYIGVPLSTLRALRYEGRGPKAGKLGKRLYYKAELLDAWVEAAFEQDTDR